jgi:hypothetical protein
MIAAVAVPLLHDKLPCGIVTLMEWVEAILLEVLLVLLECENGNNKKHWNNIE